MNLMCPFIFGKNCVANTFKTKLRNMNSYETNIPIFMHHENHFYLNLKFQLSISMNIRRTTA